MSFRQDSYFQRDNLKLSLMLLISLSIVIVISLLYSYNNSISLILFSFLLGILFSIELTVSRNLVYLLLVFIREKLNNLNNNTGNTSNRGPSDSLNHLLLHFDENSLFSPSNASWCNFGYWNKKNQTLAKSSENLAIQLAEFCLFNEGNDNTTTTTTTTNNNINILDCGSGCCDQDIVWIERYPNINHIFATNISTKQVHYSKDKIQHYGLSNKITSIELDANLIEQHFHSMRQKNNVVIHRITALDCAYHFNTRKTFFEQSYELLENNGYIGLVDLCITESTAQSLIKMSLMKLFARLSKIPLYNLYTVKEYENTMKSIGFSNIAITDKSSSIMKPFYLFITEKSFSSKYINPVNWVQFRVVALMIFLLDQWKLCQFILVRGQKKL